MDRTTEPLLIDFCLRQRQRFSVPDWFAVDFLPRKELAVVAYFLASVSWYGHRPQLLSLALEWQPEIRDTFVLAMSAVEFDCARFSHLLRDALDYEATLS